MASGLFDVTLPSFEQDRENRNKITAVQFYQLNNPEV